MNTVEIHLPTTPDAAPLWSIVQQATDWLRPILEGSPEPLTATWEPTRDMQSGQQSITLRLAGIGAGHPFSVSGVFKPAQLQNRDFAESAFRVLFLEYLRDLTHLLFDRADLTPAGSPG